MRSAETARRFQSTLPARGATGHLCFTSSSPVFQSTLPARGATAMAWNWKTTRYFNPRSPHGERPRGTFAADFFIKFQSTLPARGATKSADCDGRGGRYFNPRSPHGERLPPMQTCGISRIFQSTLPARGATFSASPRRIHSPYFNPRSPHGERHRGCFRFGNTHIDISIHAPRTGSDVLFPEFADVLPVFQSTLPARGATKALLMDRDVRSRFQSTLPARGATA